LLGVRDDDSPLICALGSCSGPVLYCAPYEVTETGWGEFVIGITINFHEISGLDPIQLQHTLKLFPGNNLQPSTKKPVSMTTRRACRRPKWMQHDDARAIYAHACRPCWLCRIQVMSEVYDEFVFVNPPKDWFDLLHSGPTRKVDHHPLMPYCQQRAHTRTLERTHAHLHATPSRIRRRSCDLDIGCCGLSACSRDA
jgi:hypothetical protein